MADYVFGNTALDDVFEPSSSNFGPVTGFKSFNVAGTGSDLSRKYKESTSESDRIADKTYYQSFYASSNAVTDLRERFQKKNTPTPLLTIDGYTVQGLMDSANDGVLQPGFYTSDDAQLSVKVKVWFIPSGSNPPTLDSLTASLNTNPLDPYDISGSFFFTSSISGSAISITTESIGQTVPWEFNWLGLDGYAARTIVFSTGQECTASSFLRQQLRVSISLIPELTYAGSVGNCSVRCKALPEFPITLQLTGSFGELAYIRVANLSYGTASLSSSFTSDQVLLLDGVVADRNSYGRVMTRNAPIAQFFNNTPTSSVYLLDANYYETSPINLTGILSCDTSSVSTGSNPVPSGSVSGSLEFLGDSTNAAFYTVGWVAGTNAAKSSFPSTNHNRQIYSVRGLASDCDGAFSMRFRVSNTSNAPFSAPITASFVSNYGTTSSIIPAGVVSQDVIIPNPYFSLYTAGVTGSYSMSLSMGYEPHWDAARVDVFKQSGTGRLSRAAFKSCVEYGSAGTHQNAWLISENHNFGIAKQMAMHNFTAGGYVDSFKSHTGFLDSVPVGTTGSQKSNYKVDNPSLQGFFERGNLGYTVGEIIFSGYDSGSAPLGGYTNTGTVPLVIHPLNGPGLPYINGSSSNGAALPLRSTNSITMSVSPGYEQYYTFAQWVPEYWVTVGSIYSSPSTVIGLEGQDAVVVPASFNVDFSSHP
jgi:hypothetical protein